jgi:hypothetical protein
MALTRTSSISEYAQDDPVLRTGDQAVFTRGITFIIPEKYHWVLVKIVDEVAQLFPEFYTPTMKAHIINIITNFGGESILFDKERKRAYNQRTNETAVGFGKLNENNSTASYSSEENQEEFAEGGEGEQGGEINFSEFAEGGEENLSELAEGGEENLSELGEGGEGEQGGETNFSEFAEGEQGEQSGEGEGNEDIEQEILDEVSHLTYNFCIIAGLFGSSNIAHKGDGRHLMKDFTYKITTNNGNFTEGQHLEEDKEYAQIQKRLLKQHYSDTILTEEQQHILQVESRHLPNNSIIVIPKYPFKDVGQKDYVWKPSDFPSLEFAHSESGAATSSTMAVILFSMLIHYYPEHHHIFNYYWGIIHSCVGLSISSDVNKTGDDLLTIDSVSEGVLSRMLMPIISGMIPILFQGEADIQFIAHKLALYTVKGKYSELMDFKDTDGINNPEYKAQLDVYNDELRRVNHERRKLKTIEDDDICPRQIPTVHRGMTFVEMLKKYKEVIEQNVNIQNCKLRLTEPKLLKRKQNDKENRTTHEIPLPKEYASELVKLKHAAFSGSLSPDVLELVKQRRSVIIEYLIRLGEKNLWNYLQKLPNSEWNTHEKVRKIIENIKWYGKFSYEELDELTFIQGTLFDRSYRGYYNPTNRSSWGQLNREPIVPNPFVIPFYSFKLEPTRENFLRSDPRSPPRGPRGPYKVEIAPNVLPTKRTKGTQKIVNRGQHRPLSINRKATGISYVGRNPTYEGLRYQNEETVARAEFVKKKPKAKTQKTPAAKAVKAKTPKAKGPSKAKTPRAKGPSKAKSQKNPAAKAPPKAKSQPKATSRKGR